MKLTRFHQTKRKLSADSKRRLSVGVEQVYKQYQTGYVNMIETFTALVVVYHVTSLLLQLFAVTLLYLNYQKE